MVPDCIDDVDRSILVKLLDIDRTDIPAIATELKKYGLTANEAWAHFVALYWEFECSEPPISEIEFKEVTYRYHTGPDVPRTKPTIIISPPEHEIVDQAVRSLRGAPIFKRGNALCRMRRATASPDGIRREPGTPTIEILTTPALQETLSVQATYVRPSPTQRDPQRLVRCFVPSVVTNLVDARPDWPVPPLEAVIESPVLRADGTILKQRGYDESTGLYLTRNFELNRLTMEDAKDLLEHVVKDFPFKSQTVDRSAWIAHLLTPFARYAFHGCVPFWLYNANIRGSGKTLLQDGISVVFTGRNMVRVPVPVGDESEWRKRITSIVMEGDPLVSFDNIPSGSTLASSALDAALTGTSWSDRILGKSQMVKVPLLWTPSASGNNIQIGGDLARRTQLVRLESQSEHPEQRTDFTEPDLLGFIRANRMELIAASLTVLKHYMDAGKPDQHLSAFGSFQEWSDLVRSAIVYAGWADPCEANVSLAVVDVEAELLRSLVAAWEETDPNGQGLTVAKAMTLRDVKTGAGNDWQFPTLRGVLTGFLSGEQLGKTLSKFERRPIDGKCFVRMGIYQGGIKWGLAKLQCGVEQ